MGLNLSLRLLKTQQNWRLPMPKIDLSAIPTERGSSYRAPFDSPCNGQSSQRLARDSSLPLFGVNLTPAARTLTLAVSL